MLAAVALAVAQAVSSDPAGICDVGLVKQTSHGNCIYGKTYGCVSPTTMFVKNCSGVFQCGFAGASGRRPELTCKSTDFGLNKCPCAAAPAPAPPSPPAPPPGPVPPFVPMRAPNMNGKYDLGTTPNYKPGKYPEYQDYPGGVRYFDIYSPVITQRYSQVWWAALPPAELPADVVAEFAGGRTMAVVGFEVDQVLKDPRGDGRDVSVPINVVYNHHFESTMAGAGATFEHVAVPPGETPQMHGGHGAPNNKHTWALRQADPAVPLGATSSASFGGANGGEYRKSFHGYPPGTAQLISSPHSIVITPMQIDTWNRDLMDGPDKWNTSDSKFYSGPQPRNSLAPQSGAEAIYSGLLECPLTTRVRKVINANYKVRTAGRCGELAIDTAAECFEAAAKLLPAGTAIATRTTNNATAAPGCTIAARSAAGSLHACTAVEATFNHGGAADCGIAPAATYGATASLVNLTVALDAAADEARITMSGPSTVWFGVGFDAQQMGDEPWTVVVDGTGAVTERKLVDQKAGTELPASVTVVSNSVGNGVRTVVLTRPLKGKGPDYYSFDVANTTTLPFINAVGSGSAFAYHQAKLPSSLLLLPTTAPVCVCAGKPMPFGDGSCRGVITYVPNASQAVDIGAGTVNFNNECAPDPASQLLSQHNPTCDLRTYVGGQLSCHHMWSLLDADQDIPWPDRPLEYHFKFRFWYQRYNDTGGGAGGDTHARTHRTITAGWGANLGAGGGGLGAEFDVPKCSEGMEAQGCSRGPDGTWVHTVVGIQRPGVRAGSHLVAAHMHCHAPTCLSMSIANNQTGEVYCAAYPTYGGARGIQPSSSDTSRFQELGFIAVPPCVWGAPEYGLDPSPDFTGVTLRIVKRSNATFGHHGEMAHGQFYYAL